MELVFRLRGYRRRLNSSDVIDIVVAAVVDPTAVATEDFPMDGNRRNIFAIRFSSLYFLLRFKLVPDKVMSIGQESGLRTKDSGPKGRCPTGMYR